MPKNTRNNSYREQSKPTVFNVREECTVAEFFERHMNGKSKTAKKQLLQKGAVKVGKRVMHKLDERIAKDSVVTVDPKPEAHFIMPPSLSIVYEDDWLLVVHKDAGLLTIATETEKEHTAFAYISAYLKFYNRNDKVFIVHRIDRGTSGLLIFAKSDKIQSALRSNWDRVVLSRRYVAVVEGYLQKPEGTITTWIDENPDTKKMYVSRIGVGKKAITHYRVLDEANGLSLVELELDTGRKNQIRVHMRHIGHTLCGDNKYGAATDPIGRLCLHAMQIEFVHPVDKRVLNFETPIPADFVKLFR